MRDTLRDLACAGKTVFVSSHLLAGDPADGGRRRDHQPGQARPRGPDPGPARAARARSARGSQPTRSPRAVAAVEALAGPGTVTVERTSRPAPGSRPDRAVAGGRGQPRPGDGRRSTPRRSRPAPTSSRCSSNSPAAEARRTRTRGTDPGRCRMRLFLGRFASCRRGRRPTSRSGSCWASSRSSTSRSVPRRTRSGRGRAARRPSTILEFPGAYNVAPVIPAGPGRTRRALLRRRDRRLRMAVGHAQERRRARRGARLLHDRDRSSPSSCSSASACCSRSSSASVIAAVAATSPASGRRGSATRHDRPSAANACAAGSRSRSRRRSASRSRR